MNPVQKAITERNSCRSFTGAPLSEAQVKALAEAALAAPSAMNNQPWRIVVVTDKALIDDMNLEGMRMLKAEEGQSTYQRFMDWGGKLLYNAPAMVIILGRTEGFPALDCGIVTQNVALAAHGLGLGNVVCGMANVPLIGPKGAEYQKRLGFPEGYSFGMSVLVGEAKSGKAPHELDWTKVSYVL